MAASESLSNPCIWFAETHGYIHCSCHCHYFYLPKRFRNLSTWLDCSNAILKIFGKFCQNSSATKCNFCKVAAFKDNNFTKVTLRRGCFLGNFPDFLTQFSHHSFSPGLGVFSIKSFSTLWDNVFLREMLVGDINWAKGKTCANKCSRLFSRTTAILKVLINYPINVFWCSVDKLVSDIAFH